MITFLRVASAVVDIALADSIFYCLLGRRHTPAYLSMLFAVGMAGVMGLLNYLDVHENILFVAYIVLIFLHSTVFFAGNVWLKLYAVLTLMVLTAAGTQLESGLAALLPRAPVFLSYAFYLLVILLSYALPLRLGDLPRGRSASLLALPLCVGAMVLFAEAAWRVGIEISGWMHMLLFLSFVMMTLAILALYRAADGEERRKREVELLGAQMEYFGATYTNFLHSIEDIRAFRHDARHHWGAIRALAMRGDWRSVVRYLDDMQPELRQARDVRVAADPVVDTLVRQKMTLAERHHIEFSPRIAVPERVALPYPDLCVLLANALDNAIDACLRVEDGHPRWINLHIRAERDTLFLFLENSMAVPPVVEGGNFLSTKVRRQEHGYGFRNMRNIVRKLGGEILPEWDDERFVLNCSLPMKG